MRFPSQIVELFDSHRTGDIVVFARSGYDWCTGFRGGHGGIRRHEMLVPWYFRGPGIRPVVIPMARTVDFTPTLVDLLGGDSSRYTFDGRSLASKLVGPRQATVRETN